MALGAENRSTNDSTSTSIVDDTAAAVDCDYEPGSHIAERFYLIAVFGSAVALISMVNNALLIWVLSRPHLATSQLFFLLLLAIFDTFTAMAYTLIFPTQIVYDYADSFALYEIWNKLVRPFFTLSHMAITVSSYLIVAASAERCYVSVVNKNFSPRQRYCIFSIILLIAAVSKGPTFWEIVIEHKPHCQGFGSYAMGLTWLAKNKTYRTMVILLFRNVANVFLPFLLLILLNSTIIWKIQRQRTDSEGCSEVATEDTKTRRNNVIAATRMLLVLVATYLLANLYNVVISVWENVDESYLLDNRTFYTFSTDVITLMTVVTGSLRLPIYFTCNKQIRHELNSILLGARGYIFTKKNHTATNNVVRRDIRTSSFRSSRSMDKEVMV